ncbi:hypothetical protein [Euzebyella saccharophila]|uniref:Uncharacterized protein n=1 Tax=Euzebyella saccharophila TaxID=679664 RepID=A0ABV8JK09_9FLAO|nr:hypothetical protein [Euzebyella saccharophila]
MDELGIADTKGLFHILTDWFNRTEYGDKNKDVNFEVDNDSLFDAGCQKIKDKYIITMSRGTISCLDDFFLTSFTNPLYFLGSKKAYAINPDFPFDFFIRNEHAHVSPHLRYFDYRRQLFLKRTDKAERLWPFHFQGFPYGDENRVNFAFLFSNIALSWVFFHELAHIQLGHLDYLKAKSKMGENLKIKELKTIESANEHSESLAFDRILLEWEADAMATRLTLKFWETIDITSFIDLEDSILEYALLWRGVIDAIGGVILVFEKSRLIYGESNIYPSPRGRLYQVIDTLISYLQQKEKKEVLGGLVAVHSGLNDIGSSGQILISDDDAPDILSCLKSTDRIFYNGYGITSVLKRNIDIVNSEIDLLWPSLLVHNFVLNKETQLIMNKRWFDEPKNIKQLHFQKITEIQNFRPPLLNNLFSNK